jgi:outer membrane protein assembly factor BamB
VAKGVTGRIETALGLFGVVALGVTVAIATKWNPWPSVRDYVQGHRTTLSAPATSWTERAAGQPDAVAITSTAVVVFIGDMVESRSRTDGSLLWRKEANWGALAGPPSESTVIVGDVDGKGIQAVDPHGGQQRWSDPDAVGAWTFRDAVLTITCAKDGCAIVNRAPADGATRWRVPLDTAVRALARANAGLLELRNVDTAFDAAKAASPRPMPRYLGFLHDHRVQVVDTAAAKRVREEDVPNDARSVVVGNRTVRTTANSRDGSCRYQVTGRDAATGRELWRKDGYDLRTAGGAGCEPRRDPAGGGTALIATRGDNRQVFLSAVDGRDLAVAGENETILGTDGEYGLIRTADGKQLRAVSLSRGGATVWTRDAPPRSRVGFTPYAILITDADSERVTALDPATGQVRLNVASDAVVLGVHADGVVLGKGRTVGYLGFGAVA